MMKKSRFLSVLLAAVLLFGTVTPAQTQAFSSDQTQTASLQAALYSLSQTQTTSLTQAPMLSLSQGEKGPQIPGARTDGVSSVNDYDPERDGYFAYLPILYYESPWNVTDSEKKEGDLPVIVWKNKIFVSADNLAKVAGLDKEENAGKIRFVWEERELILTLDDKMASFILGVFKEGLQDPYIEDRFALHEAPFTGTDSVSYVPLTDVCAVMGVDLIATDDGDGTIRYGINPPQRDVYDVLASFRDDDLREGYQFIYEADPAALKKAEVSSRTVLALDGLLKGDKDYALYCLLRVLSSYDYLKQYTPNQFVWNKVVLGRDPQKKDIDKKYWDRILAESLIRDLWLGTEDEVLAMANKVVDFTASDLGLLFNDITDSVLSGEDKLTDTVLFLKNNLKNTSFYMSQNTSLKYQKILDRYEKEMSTAVPKWKALGSALNGAALILKTGLACANDMKAFEGRDKVMDDALKLFLNYGGFYYVSNEAIAKMREEYKGYSQNAESYSLKKAIFDSLSEAVISGIISKGLGLGSLVLEGFKLASSLIPAYQETLDSMVAYQTSLLSIAIQQEAHLDAYTGILKSSSDAHLTLEGAELNKDIQQAYMYLKSCATTRALVQKAFEYKDFQLTRLYEEMTILGHTYGLSGEDRLRSYAERIAALQSSDSTFIEQLIPLYVSVNGKVLTWGDEKPVPDAVCEIYDQGFSRVYFLADEKGEYHDISIPIFWHEYGITEFERDFDLKLSFYSKKVEIQGDDTKYVNFVPREPQDIDDVHLLWKGSLKALVTDKESGEQIEGVTYNMEHLDPELLKKADIPTQFSGESDYFGNVILENMLPPGEYNLSFTKAGYGTETRTVTIEAGKTAEIRVEMTASYFHTTLVASGDGAAAVREDRTVRYTPTVYGLAYYHVEEWENVVSLALGGSYILGLLEDGTVRCAISDKGLGKDYGQSRIESWTDIVGIAAGLSHTVGLRSDGTVIAIGDNSYGQCNVGSWKDIVMIAAGRNHTVGLKADGTVVAAGEDASSAVGRCAVSGWKDIVQITAGSTFTAGLCKDGTVKATHIDTAGGYPFGKVQDWTGVKFIAAGPDSYQLLALRQDGTVVGVCWMANGMGGEILDAGKWRDICLVACGYSISVGVKKDGSIVTANIKLNYADDLRSVLVDWETR